MAIQIISVDWAKRQDRSAVCHICSSCKYVLNMQTFNHKGDAISAMLYRQCPKCGIEFKNHQIVEE